MEEKIPSGDTVPQESSDSNRWMSEKIDKLAASLSKAQSEIRGAEKKATKTAKMAIKNGVLEGFDNAKPDIEITNIN